MIYKCLVLGGDGFIGSHLVENLLTRKLNIRVFEKSENHRLKNLNHVRKKIDLFFGDFRKKSDLSNAAKGIDFVFHFISLSTPASTADKAKKDIQDNLINTINLLDACVKNKVKKIIFPSSGGSIYGTPKNGYAQEKSPLAPITPYSINKLCIEKYLSYYKRYYNLDYVIYRISNAYGERQPTEGIQGIIPIIIKKALNNETVDLYGNTTRDYIYIKDVACFMGNNFDKDHKYAVYNLGSGEGISLFRLVRLIEKISGIPIKVNKLKRRKFDIEKIILDVSRIKNEFAFKTKIGIEEGIKKTFYYIKDKTQ